MAVEEGEEDFPEITILSDAPFQATPKIPLIDPDQKKLNQVIDSALEALGSED